MGKWEIAAVALTGVSEASGQHQTPSSPILPTSIALVVHLSTCLNFVPIILFHARFRCLDSPLTAFPRPILIRDTALLVPPATAAVLAVASSAWRRTSCPGPVFTRTIFAHAPLLTFFRIVRYLFQFTISCARAPFQAISGQVR